MNQSVQKRKTVITLHQCYCISDHSKL